MSRIKQFPPVIFVTVEGDQSADWLNAGLTKRDVLDGEERKIVAVYKLVEAQEVREGMLVSKVRRSRATTA